MAQTHRVHEVKSPLPPDANGEDALILLRLAAREEISRPFEYVVDFLSVDSDIDPAKVLGESVTVMIHRHDDSTRYFNGLVSSFDFHGIETGYASYRAVLRPWIWFLSRNADCRIFQEVTVPDVFEKVVKERHNFSNYRLSLTESYKTREYCVQYRESDFDFVCRLLEEEGIFYFFEHEKDKHTLVLGDSYSAYKGIEGPKQKDVPFRPPGEAAVELEHISQWQVLHELQTTKVTIDDYDFTKPRVDLLSTSKIKRKHAKAEYEYYDYPGRYWETSDGNSLAKVRIEELQTKYKRLSGIGDHRDFAPGKLFKLVEYPRKAENAEYVLLKTEIEVESAEIQHGRAEAENRFDVKFTALPSRDPYRPSRRIPKPIMHGPQTAIVVGKSGEEIWTDKYGRVKLQFHWDREGESDENSSCWVRVSQAWAGDNWGAIQIPRIDQEVVVSFLEGDPDRPLVTGRVYNEDQMPPYALPDNQTQSGITSRSTKGGTGENYNELRFEDKKGEEHVYFHAERHFELKVGSAEASDGSQTIEIWKDRTADIKTGDDATKVHAGLSSLEAAQKITFKVGASTITMTPDKISLSSLEIDIVGNTKCGMSALTTDVKGGAALNLTGALVKIN